MQCRPVALSIWLAIDRTRRRFAGLSSPFSCNETLPLARAATSTCTELPFRKKSLCAPCEHDLEILAE